MQCLFEKLSMLLSGPRPNGRPQSNLLAGGLVVLAAAVFFVSCGGSSGGSGSGSSPTPPSTPSIQNVNNATDPSSPVSLPIEINGSGFQSAPGSVIFTQSSSGITATVTPNASGWSNSAIAVNVPTGDGTNQFTLPGTVTVEVKTSEGTSNSKTLNLVQTPSFQASSLTWSTTTPLPISPGLSGLRAVAVPASDTSAFVVVTGGFNGTNNTNYVFCNTINPDGKVGPSWQVIPTNPLPETIAHHAMVEADSSNSPVSSGSHFIYVIGGQVNASNTPGGTINVYMASVNSNSGAVGTWTQLASSLPQPLVGPAAAIYHGYIYLVGGLQSDGTPSTIVYSAPVKSDGTLGTWTQSANPYPLGVSFATAFGYAGNIYVLGGDSSPSIAPNAQGSSTGVTNVNFASVLNGVLGTWTATSHTLYKRKKQVTWTASGQVIDAEGVYDSTPGSQELEHSLINPDGTLGTWTGNAVGNAPGANVYNAAAILSPLLSSAGKPRFILLGGQHFVTFSPGLLSNQVYYNDAP